MDWISYNCDKCKKGPHHSKLFKNGSNPLCPIETEISLASALDGHVREEKRDVISKRLNWDGKTYLDHNCPEFVKE